MQNRNCPLARRDNFALHVARKKRPAVQVNRPANAVLPTYTLVPLDLHIWKAMACEVVEVMVVIMPGRRRSSEGAVAPRGTTKL